MNSDLVEKIAREMCTIAGHDPDELVPQTGYRNAMVVPRWYHEREWAIRAIAAHRVLTPEAAA